MRLLGGRPITAYNNTNYLVKISFLCLLELFLQEQDNFLHIPGGGHAQHNANGFTSNLHIGTEIFSF